MVTLIALLVVGGFAWKVMTPDQRTWTVQAARVLVRTAIVLARDYKRQELEPFREALRARSRWVIVMPALVAVNVGLFLWIRTHGGSGDSASLVAWGASVGPRTTNGEWWRLVTAIFLNAGLFTLLVRTAAVWQLGLTLERVAGRLAFLVAFLAGGITVGLWNLRSHPLSVSTSAAGAVFGVYGLFAAVLAAGWWRRSAITVPLGALQRLAPGAGLFLLSALFTGAWNGASTAAMGVGLVFGVLVARDVSDRTPPARRIGAVAASGLAVALVAAIFVRGITDVRPEIAELVALEQQTADRYKAAVEQFRKGRMNASDLADLIDQDIVPELQTADARIGALDGVPQADAWRVADAREYLRLRSESWRLRADGLRDAGGPAPDVARVADASSADRRAAAEARHRATTRTLGQAESTERESLATLDRIRQP